MQSRNFRVFASSRFSPLLLGLLVHLSSCSDGGTSRADNPPNEPAVVGVGDNKDPDVRVDVKPSDGQITVQVDGLPGSAKDFTASIVSVDGKETFSSARFSGADDLSSAKAKLQLPEDLASQAALVEWNLKLERTADSPELLLLESLLYYVEPYEVKLEGPARVTEGKQVAYRIVARHPLTLEPQPDRDVELQIERDDQEPETLRATTDESGAAVVQVELQTAGAARVSAKLPGTAAPALVEETIAVQANGSKLLLTSDKPLYKPGQTIQLRALALDRGGNAPVAKAEATFEVEDGKGNKVFKRSLKTDEYGIASVPFKIGNVVNEGTYKLRALVGETTSEKTVEVGQYALPKFKLETRTDKGWYSPGDLISGVVDARYFFGKAVQGANVAIEAATLDVGRNVYQKVMGQTGSDGTFEFSVESPTTLVGLPLEQGLALIDLTVTVTDNAGQQVSVDSLVRVAQSPLSVSLVPESTSLVPGIENRLNLFVTDPLGAPVADAEVTLRPDGGDAVELTTDAFGFAAAKYTPGDGEQTVLVDVVADDVEVSDVSFDFEAQDGADHVLVRTDKSVYDVGDEVAVEVFTSDQQGSIFVDWLNDGQAVDLRTLEPDEGTASFSVALDETLLGSNRIEAYVVQDDGNLVRAGRTVFVRNASGLDIDVETDQEIYAPGAPAKLTFSVKDENGDPTAAALGVQIVDEAVFSLIDARPGLLQTYFELEDDFAQPSYELHAPPGSLQSVIFDRPSKPEAQVAAQKKAEAQFAALGSQNLTGVSTRSWPGVVRESNKLLAPYYDKEKARLAKNLSKVLPEVLDAVEEQGCSLDDYWCDARSDELGSVVSGELRSRTKAFDFWGNAYALDSSYYAALVLSTTGPDEKADTDDDQSIELSWDDLDWSGTKLALGGSGVADAGAVAVGAPPALGGGVLEDGEGATDDLAEPQASPDEGPSGEGESSDGPRVRREFPETLYFNPAVITDGSGKATIELDLADSITQWRISSLGNSMSGKLGSATGAMTVFQDFFVDVDFPATLTRGDEVDFPIAVYNYLDDPQTVTLELEAADWYTALGETTLSVELEAGEVKGVNFPVRVDRVGLGTLTVRGLGSSKSDAVARTVRVVPDGKQVALAQSGSLSGTAEQRVTFDASAVEGSEQLSVNVFPTFLSQAVQGLDSMLQVPSGCFEQTTSNAWPNVLVTDYMKQTDQITPEVLLKAESLMSAGYQRLLTFEHPGGGFSWFGTDDPAPFLSVTAFGLMEFHDMAKVHEVDEAMLGRTLEYLLGEQQPDGSWEGDQSEFFSFHTSALRNTAFTLMAIGSASYEGPETELALEFIKQRLNQEDVDAYTLALVANAVVAIYPSDPLAGQLLDDLAEMAVVDTDDDTLVSWDTSGTQTNFYGYGDDAVVTTTALVVHAMLQAGGFPDLVSKGLNKLAASKDSLGNFGSTQATVWTLKTLLLAATKGTEAAVGTFVVEVDGEPVQTLELTEDQSDVMTTIDLKSFATTGEHVVDLTFTGEGKVSYNLVSSYNVPWDDAPEQTEGPLSVAVAYDRTQLVVDETITASVSVTNNTAQTQNMALVTLGLPPGFEVERDDFEKYIEAGSLSRAEVTGKQVILYVSELAPDSKQTYEYRLRATMPVKASDGGAAVSLYYQPEQKSDAPEQLLEVAAKD